MTQNIHQQKKEHIEKIHSSPEADYIKHILLIDINGGNNKLV